MSERLRACLQNKQDSFVLPFLWMHGEEKEILLQEIEAIRQSGAREFCLESRTYEAFCEDPWWDDFAFILREAEKRDMRVWLLDDKHFPTGYANGIISKKYPHLRKHILRQKFVDVAGPLEGSALLCDYEDPATEKLIGVFAFRREEDGSFLGKEIIDLTDRVRDGLVYCDLPEGLWRVFFIIDSLGGPECYDGYIDMLSKESCHALIEAVYQPHFDRFANQFGKTFRGFFSDEPCWGNAHGTYDAKVGNPNVPFPYSDRLLPQMAAQMRLSVQQVRALLPGLWFPIGEQTALLRTTYMDLLSKAFAENFSDQIGNWCREHGVFYIGHVIEDQNAHMRTGYGPGHFFRALRGQDMAGMDVVLHQVHIGYTSASHAASVSGGYADPTFFTYTLPKLAASHAHLQPLKKGRAMCEIYGAFGWAEGLPAMRGLQDWALVNGINHYVPHAFTPKRPDYDCPPHFYSRGKNPQFSLFGKLTRYTQRMCHLLYGGTHIAPAAVLYNAQAEWAGGDYQLFQSVCRKLTQSQIDFDIVWEDLLADEKTTVQNKKLCINGEEFAALIVPYSQYLTEDFSVSLSRIAAQGCPVLCTDGMFRSITGEQPQKSLFTLLPESQLISTLRAWGVPELEVLSPAPSLAYLHIRQKDCDVFVFFHNASSGVLRVPVRLNSMQNKRCVRYDAMENTLHTAPFADGILQLSVQSGTNAVYVFGAGEEADIPHYLDVPHTAEPLPLTYQVSLCPAGETDFAPYEENLTVLRNLASDAALSRFCGTVRYTANWHCENSSPVWLNLGTVGELATVTLNGKVIGEALHAPYVFAAAPAIGDNALQIDVVTSPAYAERDSLSRYLPLPPSGLLGPVCTEKR